MRSTPTAKIGDMAGLFSGEVSVHYDIAHLLTNGPEEPALPDVARRGQTNGLAVVAKPRER